ncbi:FKBP-type peptidyl-prolyl cis-trans isomerase [Escherichia coli]|uniref:FKBP-type peptidyl-prolyl cis-trans isomerase N-terminal domain-containing protein n=3 Tax=Escherichia coli TaxID=562 RepID=UPI001919CF61|nr:FKBP-type peptidyl-prolyl cis-trans isomerase N-terminal domain-containing protein [Escherichia coli]CAD6107309.1 FKBP-type peptidyl-prolyl cis-trans isomerase [Escherichia coli]
MKKESISLVVLWLVLVVLAGCLMMVLSSSRAQAAEDSDMPEVLRFARQYHAEALRTPANAGRSGAGRTLAQSELVRRQQAAQLRALKEKLKAAQARTPPQSATTGLKQDITRLTAELAAATRQNDALAKQVSTLQQQVAAGRADSAAQTKTTADLAAARKQVTDLTTKLAAVTEQNNALQKTVQTLQQTQSATTGLKQDITRLTAELAAATRQNDALAKQVSTLQQQVAAGRTDSAAQTKTTADLAAARKQVTDLTTKLAAVTEQNNALQKTVQTQQQTPVTLKTPRQRQAYAAGVMFAQDVRDAQAGNRMLGVNLDRTLLLAGLSDALNGHLRLDDGALTTATNDLADAAQEGFRKVKAAQSKLAAAWLKKFRKQKGAARDDSGFWYRVTWEGDGERLKPDDVVDVVVEEKLADGTVVSDMDRTGSGLRQRVSDFPPVFTAGLLRLKNHGQITLVVPPELAYGDKGYPPDVPPGATMIYQVRVSDRIDGSEIKGGPSGAAQKQNGRSAG